MSQTIVLDLDRQADGGYALRQDAPAADGWSARRKLLCTVSLSAAAWLVVLAPVLMIWG